MEYSIGQIQAAAEKVIKQAAGRKTEDRATLVTFSGELGAGKTTLIQEIARQLGVEDSLQSPTYVIYKRYLIPAGREWESLVHGDMYRLESAGEIERLGWGNLLADPSNIICVEWPERIEQVVPEYAIRVILAVMDEQTRSIDIKF